jgi:nucleoside-diphosphate-sugar epimerase
MLNGENGVVYNIAAEDCNVHLKDFAQICAEASGKNVVFDLPSETEMKGFSIATQAILDNSRLISSGWKPKYSMKDAVNRTINIIK